MIKRIFDISLSFFGFIFSLPIWLFIGLLICIEDGLPIFYLQERVGQDGKVFRALKFRSMEKDAEKEIGPVQAKENDYRVTKVGRILRATAMDELPQLINIFKGDMSFVGPRAMRPHEIEAGNCNPEIKNREFKNRDQKKKIENREVRGDSQKSAVDKNQVISLKKVPGYYERQSVRPGLTGLAQIYIPKDSPPQEKFRYDLAYVNKQNFWFDFKLIFLSFWVTFRGKWESREKKI